MDLRVLKYFLVVAREENITRAAALLHVTQPTLSRQLMQLEEELGVKLFRRGKYHVSLTEDGMLLRRRAQEIVELAEKTEQEFQRQEGELAGDISIGTGESNSMTDLSRRIAAFRTWHPLVRFHIYSATADEIQERLEKGLLDLGMLMEPAAGEGPAGPGDAHGAGGHRPVRVRPPAQAGPLGYLGGSGAPPGREGIRHAGGSAGRPPAAASAGAGTAGVVRLVREPV